MNHRIAMVTTVHPHDDVRIYHKQAKTLVKAGWRVEIINPVFEGSDEDGIRFRRVVLPSGRIGRIWNARKTAMEVLQKSKADICTLHDPELLPLLTDLKRIPIQTIYDAHEDFPSQMYTKPWLPKPMRRLGAQLGEALLNRYIPYADGVTTATEGIMQTLAPLAKSVCLIRNRPTEEDFNLFDIERSQTKRLPQTVCYAGALTRQRGLHRMVTGCYQAGAKLKLAGRFESEELKKSIESMPEYACVEYLGVLGRPGIARLYAQCSAGLLLLDNTPSYRNSEPIKLFEYLCAGLPVIASDFSHWRELTLTDATQFVNPESEQDIVLAIRNAIHVPLTVDVESARQQFGFKEDANRLLRFYEQLEEKGRIQP